MFTMTRPGYNLRSLHSCLLYTLIAYLPGGLGHAIKQREIGKKKEEKASL